MIKNPNNIKRSKKQLAKSLVSSVKLFSKIPSNQDKEVSINQ